MSYSELSEVMWFLLNYGDFYLVPRPLFFSLLLPWLDLTAPFRLPLDILVLVADSQFLVLAITEILSFQCFFKEKKPEDCGSKPTWANSL
jgi:hypothetical protein